MSRTDTERLLCLCAQRQDVEADVADTNWLLKVIFDDRHLLIAAFRAEEATAMPAKRKNRCTYGLRERPWRLPVMLSQCYAEFDTAF